MGSGLLIARIVARLCASYLAILIVALVVVDVAAYLYLAAHQRDLLQPILGTPEGSAVYAAQLRKIALGLALVDLPVLVVAGAAAYALALISVRPLVAAREREARFAAEAAHELRTPLARIASIAQTARGAQAEEALARIAALAVDASGTISDLLALVREERVAPKLSEPVDLGALARSAVEAAHHDGVRYELNAAEQCWVEGDERRLRRLAENLLDNAGRHARGRVRVRVVSEARASRSASRTTGRAFRRNCASASSSASCGPTTTSAEAVWGWRSAARSRARTAAIWCSRNAAASSCAFPSSN